MFILNKMIILKIKFLEISMRTGDKFYEIKSKIAASFATKPSIKSNSIGDILSCFDNSLVMF